MHKSDLVALGITLLIVLGVLLYRLLWAASSAASGAALQRLPFLPKSWRRWLLSEPRHSPR